MSRKTTASPLPTHWCDDRGFVLTAAQREKLGGDYKDFYNVPCVMVRGQATPILTPEPEDGLSPLEKDQQVADTTQYLESEAFHNSPKFSR